MPWAHRESLRATGRRDWNRPPIAAGATNPGDLSPFDAFLKKAKDWRDGVIAIAGIFYLFGVVVWSYNAWRNNLGFLPVLQFQYLIAGLAPACIGAAVLWASSFARRFEARFAENVKSTEVGRELIGIRSRVWRYYIVSTILCSLTGAVSVPMYFQPASRIYLRWISNDAVGIPIILSQFFALWFFTICSSCHDIVSDEILHRADVKRSPINVSISRGLSVSILLFSLTARVLIAAVCIYFFTAVVFPNLEQEFGGPRPRFARLVLKAADLPKPLTGLLSPQNRQAIKANGSPSDITITSDTVDVYFVGTDFMLIRGHNAAVTTPTLQLKRDMIQAIEWYGYTEPPNKPMWPSVPSPSKPENKPSPAALVKRP